MQTILAPHHELSYDEADRRDVNSFTVEEISKFGKQSAVHYARAIGLQETGMSVNEIGLLFDLLEKKGKCNIVELGRNYGCSTRIFLQHVVRHGGFLESWDLKHWGNLKETWTNQGFYVVEVGEDHVLWKSKADYDNGTPGIAHIRVADSIKTGIKQFERWVDFLLIDTEHGLENALGEFMRWRQYLKSGAMVAFHDSTLPGVVRAIEICKEVEEMRAPGAETFVREYINERVDGYGIHIMELKG